MSNLRQLQVVAAFVSLLAPLSSAQEARKDGVIVASRRAYHMVSCGDGQHSWSWKYGAELLILDSQGEEVQGSAPLMGDIGVQRVFPTSDGDHAWVFGHNSPGGNVYLVSRTRGLLNNGSPLILDPKWKDSDTGTTRNERISILIYRKSVLDRIKDPDEERSLFPGTLTLLGAPGNAWLQAYGKNYIVTPDCIVHNVPIPRLAKPIESMSRDYVWVTTGPYDTTPPSETNRITDIYVLDQQGRPLTGAAPAFSSTSANELRCVYAHNGKSVWLIDPTTGMPRLLNPDGTSESVSLWPKDRPRNDKFIPQATIDSITPCTDGKHLWFTSDGGYVSLARRDVDTWWIQDPLMRSTSSGTRVGTKCSHLVDAQDGKHAWIGGNGIYLVDTQRRNLSELSKEKPLLKGVIVECIVPVPQVGLAWVCAQDGLYGVSVSGTSIADGKNLLPGIRVHSLYPSSDGSHVWVKAQKDGGIYLVRRDGHVVNQVNPLTDEVGAAKIFIQPGEPQNAHIERGFTVLDCRGPGALSARVNMCGAELHLGSQRVSLQGDPMRDGNALVRIDADWKGRAQAVPSEGRFVLEVYDGVHRVARGIEAIGKESTFLALIWQAKAVRWDKPHELRLHYSDRNGSTWQVVWPEVTFSYPLLQRTTVRTVVVFFVLAIVVIGSGMLLRSHPTLTRWSPPALALAASGVSNIHSVTKWADVDGNLLLVLVGLGGICGLLVGTISATAFRALSRTAPYHWIAPLVVTLGIVRARIYRQYVRDARAMLQRRREKASDEQYIPIPAKICTPLTQATDTLAEHPHPSEALLDSVLRFPLDSRTHVLIEAPGGYGKSALLRQLVAKALDNFERNPTAPLPVWCDMPGDTIEAAIARALGDDLISLEILKEEMKAGGFVLAIDGLSESHWNLNSIATYVGVRSNTATPLIVTSRPKDCDAIVSDPSRWTRAEPRCLDDQNLMSFVRAYSPTVNNPFEDLSQQELAALFKATCQGPDGRYMPILVRLVIIAGTTNQNNLRSIYENALRRLLEKQQLESDVEGLLRGAGEVCLDSYWTKRERVLPFANAKEPQRTILEKLLRAGIVIAADDNESARTLVDRRLHNPPRGVRFFHDSMLSYLTARELHRSTQWNALLRAAGDPFFLQLRGSMLFDGSELFQMWVHLSEEREIIKGHLISQIGDWKRDLAGDIAFNEVIKALPSVLVQPFQTQAHEASGVAYALHVAVLLCERADTHDNAHLASFFGKLAPVVWRLKNSENRVGS